MKAHVPIKIYRVQRKQMSFGSVYSAGQQQKRRNCQYMLQSGWACLRSIVLAGRSQDVRVCISGFHVYKVLENESSLNLGSGCLSVQDRRSRKVTWGNSGAGLLLVRALSHRRRKHGGVCTLNLCRLCMRFTLIQLHDSKLRKDYLPKYQLFLSSVKIKYF